jgi:alpha-L-fucosidase
LYGPAAPEALVGENQNKEPNPSHLERWVPPDTNYLDDWLARSTELVDKYHPDFMYFDWWIGQPAFQPYLKQFAAYYYNRAVERKQPVVLTYKEESFPANAATLDIERGKMDTLRLLPWQTDTSVSIHSWGYVENDEYRDAPSLIHELVDVVSKNGNLLLNVGPKSDGTIPEPAQKILLQIGAWLNVNGEAIYGSRPWKLYGEGPTLVKNGLEKNSDKQDFTSQDIRFTTHNHLLYATALGHPTDETLVIHSLWKNTPYLNGPVCRVDLLGVPEHINFMQQDNGLQLSLPSNMPNEAAYVFRIRVGKDCR